MQLTNNGSFCIGSVYIGRSGGVAGIVEHLGNIKSILVANLCWVTWNSTYSHSLVLMLVACEAI